jgi:hypothetical protein
MGCGNGCSSFLKKFYENNSNKNGIKKIKLKELNHKTIAIDAMGFIYRAMLRSKKNWRYDIIFLIHKFNKYNIEFVFVFDDNPNNNDKEHTFLKRQEKQAKKKIMHEENQTQSKVVNQNLETLETLETQETQETMEIQESVDISETLDTLSTVDNSTTEYIQPKVNKLVITQCEELCSILGIKHIRIKHKEADEIFTFLIDNNIVDGCYSQDNDLLRRGCKTIYYDLDYNLDTIYVINYDKLLIDLNLSPDEFNNAYDASGTEYNDNLAYCKFKDAYDLVNIYGDIETILLNIEEINKEKTSRLLKIPIRFNYLKTREIFNRQLTHKNIQEIMDSVNKFQIYFEDAKLNSLEYSKILFDNIAKNNSFHTSEENKAIRQIKEFYVNTFGIYI